MSTLQTRIGCDPQATGFDLDQVLSALYSFTHATLHVNPIIINVKIKRSMAGVCLLFRATPSNWFWSSVAPPDSQQSLCLLRAPTSSHCYTHVTMQHTLRHTHICMRSSSSQIKTTLPGGFVQSRSDLDRKRLVRTGFIHIRSRSKL